MFPKVVMAPDPAFRDEQVIAPVLIEEAPTVPLAVTDVQLIAPYPPELLNVAPAAIVRVDPLGIVVVPLRLALVVVVKVPTESVVGLNVPLTVRVAPLAILSVAPLGIVVVPPRVLAAREDEMARLPSVTVKLPLDTTVFPAKVLVPITDSLSEPITAPFSARLPAVRALDPRPSVPLTVNVLPAASVMLPLK